MLLVVIQMVNIGGNQESYQIGWDMLQQKRVIRIIC